MGSGAVGAVTILGNPSTAHRTQHGLYPFVGGFNTGKVLVSQSRILKRLGIERAHKLSPFQISSKNKSRDRWREVGTSAGPVPALLPPGSWQHGEPRMDEVPALGQHTEAILSQQGYSAERIAALRADGVI